MVTVPDPINPKEKRKMIDLRNHITAAVHEAASVATHELKAEELRLFGLGHKVAGPFERLARAVRAGWAAFRAVLRSQ
jgi:hypothetical protein